MEGEQRFAVRRRNGGGAVADARGGGGEGLVNCARAAVGCGGEERVEEPHELVGASARVLLLDAVVLADALQIRELLGSLLRRAVRTPGLDLRQGR